MTGAALYFGTVVHQRLRPVRHELSYRVFSMLLDLDEIPALAQRLRLFSHNRFNLFSFHDRDHGPRNGAPPRPHVEAQLARAGIALEGGPIRLLCFPRVLGYVFNPLSIYFCHHRDGSLRAVLYEVSQHVRRAARLPHPGERPRRHRAPELRQALLRLALHGDGVPLRVPPCAAGRAARRLYPPDRPRRAHPPRKPRGRARGGERSGARWAPSCAIR